MARQPDDVQVVRMGLRALILGNERYRRRVAESLGVGITELMTMMQLHNAGPRTPRQIADYLGFSTGSTTAILDRLEGGGFIVRTPNPADRRSLLITLTPSAARTVAGVAGRTEDHLTEALGTYSPEEIAQLAQVMTTVGQTLATADSLPSRR